jgi:phosphate transport system protein
VGDTRGGGYGLTRTAFKTQLGDIEQRVEGAFDDAAIALANVARVMASSPGESTQLMAEGGRRLRHTCRGVDSELVIVTARQAPVAGDLLLVLALIEVAHHGNLVANQFDLIAAQMHDLAPAAPAPDGITAKLATMLELAGSQLARAATAFASRDLVLGRRLDQDDDAIDRLNREVFETALTLGGNPHRREMALRHVLIARSIERIGDNAVDIAEQAAFLVTAECCEFSDASRPRPKAAQAS